MQHSIEAFVADMSAQLDSVDSGLRSAPLVSDLLALRRILYLLHSLRESLGDEDSARRREALAALMAEFRQGLAAMAANAAKVRSATSKDVQSAALKSADVSQGAVVPFSMARRRAGMRGGQPSLPIDKNRSNCIAALRFPQSNEEDFAGVRDEINIIVDRRRGVLAGEAKSNARSDNRRDAVADPHHPVEMAWRMLPGIIRNLEPQLGKQIAFVTTGGRIEVSRSVIDAIRVPLIYLTRNAADHGLETAQERLRRGKLPMGTIRIAVTRVACDLVVELSDDGRGLDEGKIEKLATAGFIVEADHRPQLSPAGSPASSAGNASPGLDRGIGLDAVRRHIEAAGGKVNLRSLAGRGVTATIRIPLQGEIGSEASRPSSDRAVCLPHFPR